MLAGSLVFLLLASLRLAPGPYSHQHGGRDEDFHRYLIREYAEHDHKLPEYAARVVGGRADHDYPSFYHWLLSYLPAVCLPFVRRYSSLIFDALIGLLIAILLVRFAGLSSLAALTAGGLYTVLPGFVIIAMGPRSYSLTPRNFSQTTTGVAVLLITVWSDAAVLDWAVVAVAALFLSLSLISSKFSVQYALLILLPAAILSGSSIALLIVSAATILATLLWGRLFFRQLKGQLLHLEWYYKHGQHFFSHRGNWRRIRDALRLRQRWALLEEMLFFNPLISGCVRHFPIFLSLFVVASRQPVGFPVMLLAASVAIWLLTSLGPFRILGEAERYLEQSIAAAWFLFWANLPSSLYLPAIVLSFCYCLISFALNLRLTFPQTATCQRKELASIARAVDERPQAIVLCSHYDDLPFFLSESSARVVGVNANFSIRGNEETRYLALYDPFPMISVRRLPELCEIHSVDFVVWRGRLPATGLRLDRFALTFKGEWYFLYTRTVGRNDISPR